MRMNHFMIPAGECPVELTGTDLEALQAEFGPDLPVYSLPCHPDEKGDK